MITSIKSGVGAFVVLPAYSYGFVKKIKKSGGICHGKEKMSLIEKELARLIINSLRNPFLNEKALQEYLEKIKKEAQDGCDDSFV